MASPKNVRYWLCYDGKTAVGPYLQSAVKRWLAFGVITDATSACAADQQAWITVKDIPGIHEINPRLQGDLDYRRDHPYPADWKLPATERQLAYLSYLGSPCSLDSMTKGRASELIDALVDQFPDKVKEWNNQPATAAQKERLAFLRVGHAASVTLGQAHQLLESSITPANTEAWHEHKGTTPQGVSVRISIGKPSLLSRLLGFFRS